MCAHTSSDAKPAGRGWVCQWLRQWVCAGEWRAGATGLGYWTIVAAGDLAGDPHCRISRRSREARHAGACGRAHATSEARWNVTAGQRQSAKEGGGGCSGSKASAPQQQTADGTIE